MALRCIDVSRLLLVKLKFTKFDSAREPIEVLWKRFLDFFLLRFHQFVYRFFSIRKVPAEISTQLMCMLRIAP